MFDGDFWSATTPREARAKLVEALSYELLGPASSDEVIDESPLSRYLVGMLAPFGTKVVAEEEEEEPLGEDEGEDLVGASEFSPPVSQALSPSSIGLSCLLHSGTNQLSVTASWGDYERISSDEIESADTERDNAPNQGQDEADGSDQQPPKARPPRERWKRTAVEPTPVRIDIRPDQGLQQTAVGDGSVCIEHVARSLADGRITFSVFLVNRRDRPPSGRPPADRWIFQPELSISDVTNDGVFLARELGPEDVRTDRDLESNALLFRNRQEFAIGHGCAVVWAPSNEATTSLISTDLMPQFELPRVEPRIVDGTSLDMALLAAATSGEELEQHLGPVADAYASWLKTKRKEAQELDSTLRATATVHLTLADQSLERIRDGIALIGSNQDARDAFVFANKAMLLQRSHTTWASERQRDATHAAPAPTLAGRWRLFQIAFILQNLRGIADPEHSDRNIGDLLWFPTGGGKTEAYLGLAAFTLAMRRIRTDDTRRTDAGVSVLLRYTLRLLTIQQFQRAAALVCACEVIRRSDTARWGGRRFSIGLWLGHQATPNRHDESRLALDRLRAGESQDEANPCQLESCPWCGESLGHDDYEANTDRLRTVVRCPRSECEFSREQGGELPVLLVDEEIYRECPSLLIATVDKFAQMPWNGEIATLFGNVERECDRCGFLTADSSHPKTHRGDGTRRRADGMVSDSQRLAPPDLIIQDELHLIAGPLGTMVGLYETAVDALSTYFQNGKSIHPKVIASTATIRRAFDQVTALFARELKVFPPLALEPDDSFFAVEAPITDQPGRLYVGVMAPGKSMKTAQVRVSAALLSAAAGLRSSDDALADPYLTLVAYFNSLRELGGAVRLMEDDIGARLRQLANRGFPQRFRPIYEELTSRVSSKQIPVLLRRLETPHHVPRDNGEPFPLDAILASNMISVGVDVDRLGLMTVMGQPKTTAEYIQATSRVGRQLSALGLVVTIYNWVRPRDLSHYERFGHYHSTLYKNVEAVSATPFSSRARDRGLPGAFVSLTRLQEARLNPNRAAGLYDSAEPSVDFVIDAFKRRAEQVGGEQAGREVEAALRGYVDSWDKYAQSPPLHYAHRNMFGDSNAPDFDVLLRAAEGGEYGRWRAPNSLREVEEASKIYALGLEKDGD